MEMISEKNILKKEVIEEPPRRKFKKLVFPRRQPSEIVPTREIVFTTPDKTTCVKCPCYPKEEPYKKKKVSLQCQRSPCTLYELAADAVNRLKYPTALDWSEEEVVEWMTEVVGFPQYRECLLDNHINGMRLLMLEDPSKLPDINIRYFEHIQIITARIREEFSTDFVRFVRSVGLPFRKLFTYCTWFKSRSGPTWGIRQNWDKADILRWMKILLPAPLHLDHWDLVWYQKPEFPKVMFARIEKSTTDRIPHYKPVKEVKNEYTLPRKFRILKTIPEASQFIWIEHRPGSPVRSFLEEQKIEEERERRRRERKKRAMKFLIKEDSRLLRKKITTTEGLRGKDLILARKLKPKQKFLPRHGKVNQ